MSVTAKVLHNQHYPREENRTARRTSPSVESHDSGIRGQEAVLSSWAVMIMIGVQSELVAKSDSSNNVDNVRERARGWKDVLDDSYPLLVNVSKEGKMGRNILEEGSAMRTGILYFRQGAKVCECRRVEADGVLKSSDVIMIR